MNKKQYVRLSLVLLVPLLLLGWWLSEKEIIISHHHFFNCEEFDTHISCATVGGTKEDMRSWTSQDGAVTLSRVAHLSRGMRHPIVTVSVSAPIFVGYDVVAPATGGVRKMLSLPPRVKNEVDLAFMSCNIEPMPDSETSWAYRCFKGEPEAFQFEDESTNQKFRQAVAAIKNQASQNANMALRARIASFLTPVFAYACLSLLVFVLAKLTKFVIHGRRG